MADDATELWTNFAPLGDPAQIKAGYNIQKVWKTSERLLLKQKFHTYKICTDFSAVSSSF